MTQRLNISPIKSRLLYLNMSVEYQNTERKNMGRNSLVGIALLWIGIEAGGRLVGTAHELCAAQNEDVIKYTFRYLAPDLQPNSEGALLMNDLAESIQFDPAMKPSASDRPDRPSELCNDLYGETTIRAAVSIVLSQVSE